MGMCFYVCGGCCDVDFKFWMFIGNFVVGFYLFVISFNMVWVIVYILVVRVGCKLGV